MSITIAIPFYNAEAYLTDAIRSVFAQTHKDWELILIDDGSTDRSLEIARSVSDPRVRVISDGKNKRLAARLNEVTRLAKYEYIARMDADDLMAPDRLEIQLKILEKKPEIDLISTGLFSILNDRSLVGLRGSDHDEFTFNDLINKKKAFLHAGLLARRSWYERNKYDENAKQAEDTELWIRASKNNDFKAISIASPLYIYREEGNITPEKMICAYKTGIKSISPHIENPIRRAAYTLKMHAKIFITTIITPLEIKEKIQKKRNRTKNKSESDRYNEVISTILSTKIPGIDY